MKAVQILAYGGPEVIAINDIPVPTIGKGQVLVQMYASSINPADTGLRAGDMQAVMPLHFPVTLGGDVAGVVAKVASDVQGFVAGDKVYGQAYAMFGGSGAFAEYAAANAGQLASMPAHVSFSQAASLSLVGVSALQAITDNIALRRGQKILIHGAAGAVGAIAVQIAKHVGAYVAATVSAQNIAMVKALGADKAIDYITQHFEDEVEGYDAVLDLVGGETFKKSLLVLKPGGTIVTLVAWSDSAIASAKAKGFNAVFQGTNVTTASLNKLSALVNAGVVVPPATLDYPLDKISEAFAERENGKTGKKILIKIKG